MKSEGKNKYTGNGGLHQRVEYLPFGEEILSEHSKMDDFYSMYYFSAKEKDEESGFTHMGERYMNHMLGMFNQMDKLWDARSWESPLSYCGNNPITRRDPTGLIWDESQLTDTQKEKWQGAVKTASASSAFKTMYDDLANSETVYKVNIGATQDNAPGQYNRADNTLTFRSEQSMVSADTYMEEMFHAYQHDNLSSYDPGKSFNMEFEAKTAKYLMKDQAKFSQYLTNGTNFETMGNFLSPNGFDINMPNAETINGSTFQNGYMKGAESFMNFNIKNNVGNSHYRVPTEQSPKSLIKIFR